MVFHLHFQLVRGLLEADDSGFAALQIRVQLDEFGVFVVQDAVGLAEVNGLGGPDGGGRLIKPGC